MLRTQKFLKLGHRSRSQIPEMVFVTLRHLKMHLDTLFGIPILTNIGDMHQIQCSF